MEENACRRDAEFVSRYSENSDMNMFVEAIAAFAKIQQPRVKELIRGSARRDLEDVFSGMIFLHRPGFFSLPVHPLH